jgi:hypothetical protein
MIREAKQLRVVMVIVGGLLGLVLLAPVSSLGNQPRTASVGKTFAETAQSCSGLFVQTTDGPHAESDYRVPFGGEIVSWSYQAVTPDVIKLVVARELSPTGPLVGTARFRMVGESPRETMKGHRLNRFALRRPIKVKRGDLIGLLAAGIADHCSRSAPPGNINYSHVVGDVNPGSTFQGVRNDSNQLDIQATVDRIHPKH